ncbi:Centrin-3 [Clonorchis sinensis]|uniref:Centrin-3 n=2 Tax=Clonorchis sinensis TaxID=79923 RepID=G7YLI5_CLOSI|nr:Centrin-3 [Clonorchis sinensis]GAA53816.1 centrin-3 [Clonorchis sinensis]
MNLRCHLNYSRVVKQYPQIQVALRALGFELKKSEVLQILEDYNIKEDGGALSFEDFNEIVTDMILDRDPTTEIIRAFKLFDDDDSGRITYRNLKKVAKELGENLTDQELRAMIEEFDRDGDGAINLEEFIALMTKDI